MMKLKRLLMVAVVLAAAYLSVGEAAALEPDIKENSIYPEDDLKYGSYILKDKSYQVLPDILGQYMWFKRTGNAKDQTDRDEDVPLVAVNSNTNKDESKGTVANPAEADGNVADPNDDILMRIRTALSRPTPAIEGGNDFVFDEEVPSTNNAAAMNTSLDTANADGSVADPNDDILMRIRTASSTPAAKGINPNAGRNPSGPPLDIVLVGNDRSSSSDDDQVEETSSDDDSYSIFTAVKNFVGYLFDGIVSVYYWFI